MESFDAIVVGGGPAGSSCARALRQAGLGVLVLDKAGFPRDKVCAGWVTPQVVETLGLNLADYARSRVLQPITAFLTGLIDGPSVENRFDEPVSYGIRRCEFDHYLLERSGASLATGEPLRSLERRDGVWLVNERLRAPMLVGAGGHFCPVARHLGARPGRGEVAVTAKEAEFRVDPEVLAALDLEAERPELYFRRDLSGYGWVFRKGDYVNIGLGREGSAQLGSALEEFLGFLQRRGKLPQGTPAQFPGHAYLLYRRQHRRRSGEGVLLIGDAAGLAYPQSGEGIRTAVESGVLAAGVIADAAGHYDSATLARYEHLLRERFGEPEQGATGVLPQRLQGWLAERLIANRWFARRVLIERWFLHADEPAMKAV
jgi:geranylgeranyl reductase family protein